MNLASMVFAHQSSVESVRLTGLNYCSAGLAFLVRNCPLAPFQDRVAVDSFEDSSPFQVDLFENYIEILEVVFI